MAQIIRSIPACAGEPIVHAATDPSWKVYPRVCGGTLAEANTAALAVYPRVCGEPWTPQWPHTHGLSPRVRGNQRFIMPLDNVRIGLSPRVRGNLLTCITASDIPRAVYPRVCGGTHRRGCIASTDDWIGSIPACAGEPISEVRGHRPVLARVYPRVCGGTRYSTIDGIR